VEVALTYGDPAYYGRIGFQPITTEIAAAPYPLQFPMAGWASRWMGAAPPAQGASGLRSGAGRSGLLRKPAFW
jgi:putative acetyltransferase